MFEASSNETLAPQWLVVKHCSLNRSLGGARSKNLLNAPPPTTAEDPLAAFELSKTTEAADEGVPAGLRKPSPAPKIVPFIEGYRRSYESRWAQWATVSFSTRIVFNERLPGRAVGKRWYTKEKAIRERDGDSFLSDAFFRRFVLVLVLERRRNFQRL